MNDPGTPEHDPVYLTVADYAERCGIKEATARTRINRKKIIAVRKMIDGRETTLIEIERFKVDSLREREHSMEDVEIFRGISKGTAEIFPGTDEEDPEIFQGTERTFQVMERNIERLEKELSEYKERCSKLEDFQIECVRMAEQLKAKDAIIDGLQKRLTDKETAFINLEHKTGQTLSAKDETISAMSKTIKSTETTNEVLNHERLVVTQQLQKYREKPEEPPVITVHQKPAEKKPFFKLGPLELG